MTDRYELQHCSECSKLMHAYELFRIEDAKNNKTTSLCTDCYRKYLATPNKPDFTNHDGSFDYDFVPDSSKDSSKPATDVDIHKIIDDAMEKKDRSVTIYINSVGTSVYVNPYEDKPLAWVESKKTNFNYECPACGDSFRTQSPYCPTCGEKLKLINIYD